MSESVHLETLARPDLNGEVRLTLERDNLGRRAIVVRLWKRDQSGRPYRTNFGVSIRPGEIARWQSALARADNLIKSEWNQDAGERTLSSSERMSRFLRDAEQLKREKSRLA